MKNKIYTLLIAGLAISSCCTANLYTLSSYDDAIYTLDPDKATVLNTATNRELQDLKSRTADAEKLIIRGEEAKIIYFDENGVADIPIDSENTFIVLDSTMSYEEILRKFESPDYTINLYIRDEWRNSYDYFDRWGWGYNPWRYRSYGSYWDRAFYHNWAYGGYYSPYSWNPFYDYYFDYYYSPFYNPWYTHMYYDRWYGSWGGPTWYAGGNYGGNYSGHLGGRSYYNGKRKQAFGNESTRYDERQLLSGSGRNTSSVERVSAGRYSQGDTRTSNSMYRKTERTGTLNDQMNYSGTSQTRQSMRPAGTTGTSQSSYKRSSTGTNHSSAVRLNSGSSGTTYRRSSTPVQNSSVGARNSGNSFNSTTYRRSGESGTSRTSTSYGRSSTTSGSSSSYTRSSSNTGSAPMRSSSGSSSGSSSSSSNSSSSSSSSSSGSAYRR